MKDQVTSIEQSKRLIEIGVRAEKASMFIVGDVGVYPRFYVEAYPNLRRFPAFTVADLLEMLPYRIEVNNDLLPRHPGVRLGKGKTTFELRIGRQGSRLWRVGYESVSSRQIDGLFEETRRGVSLVDCCCEIIEWLLANGYMLEV